MDFLQILAINRAESQNVLSIEIELPNDLFEKYEKFCKTNFNQNKTRDAHLVLEKAITKTYAEFCKSFANYFNNSMYRNTLYLIRMTNKQ